MKKLAAIAFSALLLVLSSSQVFAGVTRKVVANPSSITALINKEFMLPENYKPSDLVRPDVPAYTYSPQNALLRKDAAKAIEKLYAAAKSKGLHFFDVSGYRPYSLQKSVYENEVARVGEEKAGKQVAYPGTSEHQSGLAMDISCEALGGTLSESFGDTEVGKWVAKNAHKYGLIIRYQKHKVHITKYDFEPWHLRYVGVDFATYLYNNDYCMEEYFSLNAKNTNTSILLDGESIKLKSYNIGNNNYYKIRDIAALLYKTDCEFDVAWNEKEQRVEVLKNTRYRDYDGMPKKGDWFNRPALVSTMPIYDKHKKLNFKGYLVEGNNYYKLRDMGEYFGFKVDWDQARQTIVIDTKK